MTESIVTENGGGGILAESSRARVVASHLLNNGGWGVRGAGEATEVDAAGNWWGTDAPVPAELAPGGVRIDPALSAPIPIVGPGELELGNIKTPGGPWRGPRRLFSVGRSFTSRVRP